MIVVLPPGADVGAAAVLIPDMDGWAVEDGVVSPDKDDGVVRLLPSTDVGDAVVLLLDTGGWVLDFVHTA